MVEGKKTDEKKEETSSGKVKKGEFVELKFTGTANGEVFDSNVAEELKKINPKAEVKKMVIVVGEGMVVSGLDKGLEGKEVEKEYEIKVPWKEGFGERRRELIRVIPLAKFTERKVDPQPGMVLALDENIVKIIAVSGARVTGDFNNPLAGKDLVYKITIVKKVVDVKERAEALFEMIFRFVPEFSVSADGKKVVVKGKKELEIFVKSFGEKFKELMGLNLEYEEEKEVEKKEKVE